jgi:hypothetical protein
MHRRGALLRGPAPSPAIIAGDRLFSRHLCRPFLGRRAKRKSPAFRLPGTFGAPRAAAQKDDGRQGEPKER